MSGTKRISSLSVVALSACALTSLLACGMSYESEMTGTASSPIIDKVDDELPPSVVKVEVSGYLTSNTDPYSERDVNACHGVLLDQGVVLTAAHCFAELELKDGIDTTVLGQKLDESAVTFHSQAWADGATALTSTRPNPNSVNAPFDLAIVRLKDPVTDHPVARLWNPGGATAPSVCSPVAGPLL